MVLGNRNDYDPMDYYDDDDDIGLPAPPPEMEDDYIGLEDDHIAADDQHPNRNNNRHLDDDDDEITGLEDDEHLDNTSTSNNQSTPTPPELLNYLEGPEQTLARHQNVNLEEFAPELVFTLASKPEGYTIINELKADFEKDTGYIADLAAFQFGFPDFQTMIKSDLFSQWVDIRLVDGEPTFLPKDCSRFGHIREEMMTYANTSRTTANVEEERKLARALLPENREAALNGRKKITEILYELGGESQPVSWQDIQNRYQEKYDRELAGKELKDMFQRDKALAIIQQQFTMEVELYNANLPGQFCLKLKKPYQELLNIYDEQLNDYRRAVYTVHNSQEYNPPGPSEHRRKLVFATEPLYPNSLAATTNHMQSSGANATTISSSGINNANDHGQQSVTAHPSISMPDQNRQQEQQHPGPGTLNAPTAIPTQNTVNSKFDIEPEQLVCRRPEDLLPTSSADGPQESALNTSDAFSWGDEEEGEHLSAYEIGQGLQAQNGGNNGIGQQQQQQQQCSNGNGNANNGTGGQAPKKPKYTACDGDVTDSEEEEITTIVGESTRPTLQTHGQPPQSMTAAQSQASEAFRPMSQHQREIQNYMAQHVQKNDNTASGTNAMATHQQRNLTLTSNDQQEADTGLGGKSKAATTVAHPLAGNNFNNNTQSQPGQPLPGYSIFQPSSAGGVGGGISGQPQNSTFQNALGGNGTGTGPAMPNINHCSNVPPPIFVPGTPRAESVLSSMTIGMGSSHVLTDATADWMLMDKANILWAMATKKGLSHEHRPDELTFVFRNNNTKLIFSDIDNKIRQSTIHGGRVFERYYPKVDWEMFAHTIFGILDAVFNNAEAAEISATTTAAAAAGPPPIPTIAAAATASSSSDYSHLLAMLNDPDPEYTTPAPAQPWGCPPGAAAQQRSQAAKLIVPKPRQLYHLVAVPEQLKLRPPPYPAYRTTTDGRDFLCFFTKIYGFSNHYGVHFTVDDVVYNSSEQYYMFQKASFFGYEQTAYEIMATADPGTIKRLGTADTLRQRRLDGMEPDAREFDHDEWKWHKRDIMRVGLRHKFKQNNFLFNMLLDTGDSWLLESSPSDTFWGTGCHMDSEQIRDPDEWRGENWMGRLLMEIRHEFVQTIKDSARTRRQHHTF